jgi:glycerol uptake facilitator-like aquaporin
MGLRSWLRPGPVRRRDSRGRGHLGPERRPGQVDRPPCATAPAAGVSAGRVLAAEAVVTFVLVLVVMAVATDSRVPRGIAAMAIGAALAVAIVISGPVSAAGVNPARAIGPMILAGQFSDWWAYLAAPLAGGAIAVALYDKFLHAGNTPA